MRARCEHVQYKVATGYDSEAVSTVHGSGRVSGGLQPARYRLDFVQTETEPPGVNYLDSRENENLLRTEALSWVSLA